MYKYRIIYLLSQLSKADYDKARRFIPKVLNISESTWKRWKYLKKDSGSDIPSWALPKIAQFFDCPVDDLFNSDGIEIDLKKRFKKFKTDSL